MKTGLVPTTRLDDGGLSCGGTPGDEMDAGEAAGEEMDAGETELGLVGLRFATM